MLFSAFQRKYIWLFICTVIQDDFLTTFKTRPTKIAFKLYRLSKKKDRVLFRIWIRVKKNNSGPDQSKKLRIRSDLDRQHWLYLKK